MYFISRLFETQLEGMGSHSLKLCGNNPQDDTYISHRQMYYVIDFNLWDRILSVGRKEIKHMQI